MRNDYQVIFVWKIWSQGQCITKRHELAGGQRASEGILHNLQRRGFSLLTVLLLPRQNFLTKFMKINVQTNMEIYQFRMRKVKITGMDGGILWLGTLSF